VHHWLLFKKYTSIKHLVYLYLTKFLSVYTKDEEIICLGKKKIPLYQGKDNQKILYISSVAIKFSLSDYSKAVDIVRELAAYFSENDGEIFSTKILPSALIHIEITDLVLAAWLNNLTTTGIQGNWEEENEQEVGSKEKNSFPLKLSISTVLEHKHQNNLLFKIQYAHARCCSLLRLAHKEGLVEIADQSVDFGYILCSKSIPWLNSVQKLRFNEPEEVNLIYYLVKAVDDLLFPNSDSSVNWEKAGLKLSQAFESFWSTCRIWGEVKVNCLELSQARLGLLIATQVVLRSILETKLGVFAPLEL
jgi:hypothetical protein